RNQSRPGSLKAATRLNHGSVWNNAIFGDDDYTVADVIADAVRVHDAGFVDQPDVLTDVGVFVDDRVPHDRAAADAHVRNSELTIVIPVVFIFVVIGSHHQSPVEGRSFTDDASDTDDRIHNAGAFQDGAFREQGLADFTLFDSRGRQKSRTREDRRHHIVK